MQSSLLLTSPFRIYHFNVLWATEPHSCKLIFKVIQVRKLPSALMSLGESCCIKKHACNYFSISGFAIAAPLGDDISFPSAKRFPVTTWHWVLVEGTSLWIISTSLGTFPVTFPSIQFCMVELCTGNEQPGAQRCHVNHSNHLISGGKTPCKTEMLFVFTALCACF